MLGKALREALGDKGGVRRFASSSCRSTRRRCRSRSTCPGARSSCTRSPVARVDRHVRLRLAEEFCALRAGGRSRCTSQLRYGRTPHHMIEAPFKASRRSRRVRADRPRRRALDEGRPCRTQSATWVLDYGSGNCARSRRRSRTSAPTCVTTDPDASAARRVVIPGVGPFGRVHAGAARRGLESRRAARDRPAVPRRLPRDADAVRGERRGRRAGLGVLPGRVGGCPDAVKRAAHGLEHGRVGRRRAPVLADLPDPTSVLLRALVRTRRRRPTRSARPSTAARSPRSWRATTCSPRSSTPRSPARRGCSCTPTSCGEVAA